MAEEILPFGWEKHLCKTYGQYYYFNVFTNESQWHPPNTPVTPVSSSFPEKVECSHILVKHKHSKRPFSWREKIITRTEEEALQLICLFHEYLVLGGASFGKLAQKYSDCHSAKWGGSLGTFGRGTMWPAFEVVAFGLRVGELNGPVYTDAGFHLILRTA